MKQDILNIADILRTANYMKNPTLVLLLDIFPRQFHLESPFTALSDSNEPKTLRSRLNCGRHSELRASAQAWKTPKRLQGKMTMFASQILERQHTCSYRGYFDYYCSKNVKALYLLLLISLATTTGSSSNIGFFAQWQ